MPRLTLSNYREEYVSLISQDVKDFIEELQDQVSDQYTVTLGGGYLRDKILGKCPKDVDIFFTPRVSDAKFTTQLPAGCYVQYNKDVSSLTNTSDMKERGVVRVVGISNKKLSTPLVQFIVYKDPMIESAIAEDFDINICQVVWQAGSNYVYTTIEFNVGITTKVIKSDKTYNATRMYERFIRMMDKFPTFSVIGMPPVPERYRSCSVVRAGITGLAKHISERSEGSFIGGED